ncbi:unnamed protein product [Rotaria sordida]|uniref:Fucosyltransferase n=1 Tax=Rotaria sordida TaxID=392033 RepID=A0A819MD83_9BILA|nr:unnamed protein product [Rotaria sordida]CAF3977816.1 unnamed protein product [Rotaria sordida]
MNGRYCIRLCRIFIILLTISILFLWLIPLIKFYFNNEKINIIVFDENFLDNHLYPPPWYISNWTINDYFIRKDNIKKLEDKDAINKKQKIIIEYDFLNQKKNKKTNYTILEYTTVFNAPKFCGKSQDFIFGKQCPYQNCRYTCNRNFSSFADVLLMHRSDINFNQLPIERNPEQIWLYWHDEPGGVQKQAISYQFNWTISYRFNAEVNIGAYGLTILRNKPLSSKEFNSYINQQFNNRQSNAIWFVSNCKSKARINYYKQLYLHYPLIKVYGHCIVQNKTNHCHRHSQCEFSELSKNKFYLAFESQSCRDYITEKFWRSLAYGIIPIVFGPHNKQSIEKIAPPNSFIYTGDFISVSKLANYLNEISRNRTLFKEYHQWRRFYEVLYRPEDIEHYRFCELCYRLNTNQNRIYYQNLNTFFLEEC